VRTYDNSGGFDVLAFGFGFKASQTLRVGGTLNRWFNGYEQNFERVPRRRVQRLDRFDLSAWNVNLGVIWSPVEDLNLAAVGKTPFTAKVVLYRERTDIVTGEDGAPDEVFPTVSSESDDVRLEFPGAWGVGASWRPRNNLTFSSDYTRTYWSKARIENYFTLLQVPETETSVVRTFDSLVWPNVDAEKQADSIQLRFGVEYIIFAGRVKVPVRAGYINEQIYTLDYRGKAPHLNSVTVGTGLIAGSALLDVAYQYQEGSYYLPGINPFTTKTHRVFASVIYRWGGIR
jgi:long-subunit fatty acid transport protein